MLRLRRSRIVAVLTLISCFLFYNLYAKSQAYEWAKSYAIPGAQNAANGLAQEAAKPLVQDSAATVPAKAGGIPEVATSLFAFTSTSTRAETTVTSAITSSEDLYPGLVVDTRVPPKPGQTSTSSNVANIDPEAFGKALGGPPTYSFPSATSTSSTSSTSSSTSLPPIHWTKLPEHFPVPTDSIIPLPTNKAKTLPKVQHEFKGETSLERGTREERQAEVLRTFKKSWDGYSKYAWLHDELSPVSGKFRDPFCGWAATLVDSLDSLLIMGLDKEFEEALEALKEIDFTTTPKQSIPLFETTIRYLGGLLSAYDLSGHKHQILLDKAVELAEVLMGAFDTPNRMPQTFYNWKPAFVANPHRAGTRVVMAELGSLSMEFTRLAQLTQNDLYYDAIARITNELEIMQQKTKIPGLWPLYIDASGCKKPSTTHSSVNTIDTNGSELRVAYKDMAVEASTTTIVANVKGNAQHAHDEPTPIAFDHETNKGRIQGWGEQDVDRPEAGGKVPTRKFDGPVLGANAKRQLGSTPAGLPLHDRDPKAKQDQLEAPLGGPVSAPPAKVDCQPQGLASPPGASMEEFAFGGMADSTYEYLPKQFALLGGSVSQYQSMYENAIEAANEWLLYRPMTPKNEHILALGTGKIDDSIAKGATLNNVPDLGHLLCFTGGMYGLGAKLFGREDDMEIAKQMTDACVWAYGVTETGIMPEGMNLIKCGSISDCKWNQTLWEETLDPNPERRIRDGRIAKQRIADAEKENAELEEAFVVDDEAKVTKPNLESEQGPGRAETRTQYLQGKQAQAAGIPAEGELGKRQVAALKNDGSVDSKAGAVSQGTTAKTVHDKTTNDRAGNRMEYIQNKGSEQASAIEESIQQSNEHRLKPTSTMPYADVAVLDHSKYVEHRMEEERLPKGVAKIGSRKYILRPEAIESVFYMYRITGDPIWREKGWKMFQAVQAATDTRYGASAILDVTRYTADGDTTKLDEMESFWLAETLKYFYLLFSEESLVSLDEWVLNTEAHPFKRPTVA